MDVHRKLCIHPDDALEGHSRDHRRQMAGQKSMKMSLERLNFHDLGCPCNAKPHQWCGSIWLETLTRISLGSLGREVCTDRTAVAIGLDDEILDMRVNSWRSAHAHCIILGHRGKDARYCNSSAR